MTTNKPDAIVEKKRMTLRRWLYEHSPQAENLLRRFDEECDEIITTLKQPATIDEAVIERAARALMQVAWIEMGMPELVRDECSFSRMEIAGVDATKLVRAALTAVGFKMEGR